MSKVNQIQTKINELNGGQFQTLCDSFLSRRFGVDITSTGSQDGTDKTVSGTPDSYFIDQNDKYIFIEHTTKTEGILKKIKDDLEKCFNEKETGVSVDHIAKIIYCHTKKISASQHLEISNICTNHKVEFEHFDTSSLSRQLVYRYPDVAKEELGVELDTDQIISPDRFISSESKTISLRNNFYFREKEKETLLTSLKNKDIVVLTGGAGVGKTRLALECIQDFSADFPDFDVYCIRNRSVSLFEDFKIKKSLSDKILLIVDDANRVVDLTTILSYINENNSKRCVKLILTVRNYAVDLIIKELEKSEVGYARILIEPFESSKIKTIISSDSFNITNPYFISRICTVSQGNTRLAVMAAEVVKKSNKLEDLNDVSIIYDRYFSEIRDILFIDSDSITEKVLAIVSYFYSISKKYPPEGLYDKFGITENDFWETIYKLNEHELVDLHEDVVCKISDQVLGTYILYRVFFTKKILDFKIFVFDYFQRNIERMRETIYPIINTFNREYIVEYLKPIIDELSDLYLINEEKDYSFDLADVFYFVNPEKSLVLIQEYIKSLSKNVEQTEFDTNYQGLTDKLLILIRKVGNLGDDYLHMSIHLAIKYVLKCNSAAHQFGQYIVRGFDFDLNHTDESIYKQKILFEILIESSKANKIIEKALIYAIPHFLQIQHNSSLTHGMKITLTDFGLVFTKQLKELRVILLNYMDSLNKNKFLACLDKYTDKMSIHYNIPGDELLKAIKFDSDFLLSIIESKANYDTLYECRVISKYLKKLIKSGIESSRIEKFQNELLTKNYKLYLVLSPDRLERIEMRRDGLSDDEIHRLYQAEQLEVVSVLNIEEIEVFLNYLCVEVDRNRDKNLWEINNVLINLFSSLKKDYLYFLEVLKITVLLDDRLVRTLHSVPSIFFNNYPESHKELYKNITKLEYSNKTLLKFHFLSTLPLEYINDFYVEELKTLVVKEYLGLEIYFDNLIRYEKYQSGLLLVIIRAIYEHRDTNGISFSYLLNPYTEIKRHYIDVLFKEEDLLKDIWFYEIEYNKNIDSDDFYFETFISNSHDFIFQYLEFLYTKNKNPSEHTSHPNFTHIWTLDNYKEIMERVLEYIHSKEEISYVYSFVNTFFSIKETKTGLTKDHIREKQIVFLKSFIDEHHSDIDLMSFLFEPIKSYFGQEMPGLTLRLLKLENSEKVFSNIEFDPNIYSGGRTFVTAYERAMGFWVKLQEKLNTPDLITARLYVSDKIDYWKRRIKNEHERDFSSKY